MAAIPKPQVDSKWVDFEEDLNDVLKENFPEGNTSGEDKHVVSTLETKVPIRNVEIEFEGKTYRKTQVGDDDPLYWLKAEPGNELTDTGIKESELPTGAKQKLDEEWHR